MASQPPFIQYKFNFSLFLCVEKILKDFSINIYCDAVMYASGTVVGAGDTEMTETSYRQCDSKPKYLT